jgi:hypothetical protein
VVRTSVDVRRSSSPATLNLTRTTTRAHDLVRNTTAGEVYPLVSAGFSHQRWFSSPVSSRPLRPMPAMLMAENLWAIRQRQGGSSIVVSGARPAVQTGTFRFRKGHPNFQRANAIRSTAVLSQGARPRKISDRVPRWQPTRCTHMRANDRSSRLRHSYTPRQVAATRLRAQNIAGFARARDAVRCMHTCLGHGWRPVGWRFRWRPPR